MNSIAAAWATKKDLEEQEEEQLEEEEDVKMEK